MIRINLMPRAEARREASRQRGRQAMIAMAAIVASLVLAAELTTRARLREVEHTVRTYEGLLAELRRKSEEARELDRARAEIEAKLATTRSLELRRSGVVRMLADLSDSTPEKLWLTEMRESAGSVSLSGRGLDDQTIATFLADLEESPHFSEVDLVETKQVEEGPAKLKEFSIRAAVAPAAAAEDDARGGRAYGPVASHAGPRS